MRVCASHGVVHASKMAAFVSVLSLAMMLPNLAVARHQVRRIDASPHAADHLSTCCLCLHRLVAFMVCAVALQTVLQRTVQFSP